MRKVSKFLGVIFVILYSVTGVFSSAADLRADLLESAPSKSRSKSVSSKNSSLGGDFSPKLRVSGSASSMETVSIEEGLGSSRADSSLSVLGEKPSRETLLRESLAVQEIAPDYVTEANVVEIEGGILVPSEECIQNIIKDYLPEMDGHTITASRVGGGGFTEAIYMIKFAEKANGKGVLFVKISKTNGENKPWENLQEVQVQIADKMVGPVRRKQPDLPILTMAEKFLRYSFRGEEKIIEITHAAQGSTPDALLLSPDVPVDELQASNEAVGRSLSLFHQHFMVEKNPKDVSRWETILHGDFHQMNMFVRKFEPTLVGPDMMSKAFYRVYFIDNETMINTIRAPQPILLDVLRYCIQRLTGSKGYMYERLCNSQFCQPRYRAMVSSFLKGYIDAFPVSKRFLVAQYIERELGSRIDHLIEIIRSKHFLSAPDNLKDLASANTLKDHLHDRIRARRSPIVDAEMDMFLRSCVKMQQMNMAHPDIQASALEKIESLAGAIKGVVGLYVPVDRIIN